MYSILTHSISKNYKGFQALKNVNLAVKPGEIYGFIGLNGAGKTTMMRMLLNMIEPSEGACLDLRSGSQASVTIILEQRGLFD
nr:ATP-binding cassette domain-containing protein [Liquorilactobacillus satsumensis]